MTETERADRIARGPRRRFAQNIVMIAALLLALAAFIIATHEAQQRAQDAETSELSLAQQVQAACDSQGSLDLDGRDLCEQADEVIEGAPVAGPAGVPGIQGERGYTGAQGIQGRTGPPGEIGPRGPLGPRGEAGADGADGADGAPGANGADGENGADGIPGADGQPGKDGADGAPGKDGRGIAKIECHTTGDWIFTYTDGTATTVEGPCRAEEPTPSPTPTTILKR